MVQLLPLRRAIASALACVALWACGESGESDIDAGPPTLELGTGASEFESLSDGDTIYIVQGPQDGYHFFGSLRASNIDPGNYQDLSEPRNPQTTFEVYVGSEQVDLMASTYKQGLRPSEGGVEMVGRTVILDIADDAELEGVEVRFVVEVLDADGIRVSDERVLSATAHPNNR